MIKANTPEPKIILDRSEYDDLIHKEMKLEIIRRGMEQHLVVYHTSKMPFLNGDFIEVLKVIFPFDFERKVRELIKEEEQEGGEA